MAELSEVAKLTKNDVIIAIIAVAIAIIIIYPLFNKAAEKKRRGYLDREKLIINVIQENTRVNSGLVMLLETNNTNCAQCKQEQSDKMDLVIGKLDLHNNKIVEVATILKERGDI